VGALEAMKAGVFA